MFNKILLAADGSEHSLGAADKAIELAGYNEDAIVEVLYVVNGDASKADVLHYWNSAGVGSIREEKMKAVEEQAKKSGVKYEIKVVRGEPGPEIVRYAKDNTFDLIVIGSRGLNVFQEMVLGSVSHKVAKRAHCPVMIVK